MFGTLKLTLLYMCMCVCVCDLRRKKHRSILYSMNEIKLYCILYTVYCTGSSIISTCEAWCCFWKDVMSVSQTCRNEVRYSSQTAEVQAIGDAVRQI
jgi:hypothetical protein